jgi:transcriptional regulator with XRE-family HTH domain
VKDKGPKARFSGDVREWAVRLDEALTRARITNMELGREMGVHNSQVSMFRHGKRTPSPEQLAHMIRRAGVSADYVLQTYRPDEAERIEELKQATLRSVAELLRVR